MRLLFLFSSLFLFSFFEAKGQSFNPLVPDQEVLDFLEWFISDIDNGHVKRTRLKKVLAKPVPWNQALVGLSGPVGDSVTFSQKFDRFLLQDNSIFDTEIETFQVQYAAQTSQDWPKSLKGARIRNRYNKNKFQFTVPLFSSDRNQVLIWSDFYCGRLCAHTCAYLFKKSESGWTLVKSLVVI